MKKAVLLCLFLWNLVPKTFAQEKVEQIPELESLQILHSTKKMDDTVYMQNFIKKIKYQYYFSPAFYSHLEYYKNVSFSKERYYKYRSQYYKFQSNIASYKSNDGARLFYAEKIDQELRKSPDYIPTLSSLMIDMNLYANWSMPEPGLEKCKYIWPFMDSLPLLIRTKNIPYGTVHNALFICIHTQKLFYLNKDTIHAEKNIQIVERIKAAADSRKDIYTPDNLGIFDFCVTQIKYQKAVFTQGFREKESLLKQLIQKGKIAQDHNFVWGTDFLIEHTMLLIETYVEEKKIDSAFKYLANFKKMHDPDDLNWNQDENILLLFSQVDYVNGNYKKAYDTLRKAYRIKDSIIDLRLSDIKNNNYAQTQAEFNKAELEKVQHEKKKRNQLIIIITLVLGIGLAYLYYLMRQKEKKAILSIKKLETASNLQVSILEEQNRLAKLEEQERLGMELHDDLAATIALVKISMENEINNTDNESTRKKLKELNELIQEAYTRTRNKSHQLFHSTILETETSFRERILSLMENGLPDNKFKKEIIIEEGALQYSSVELKKELLYIIQEAITNIIKHAKASSVDIFIYKDEAQLVLQINDNGKGFDIKKQDHGIGFKSIEQRVSKLNGKLELSSDKTGTMVKVIM